MVATRFLGLALLGSVLFQVAAKDVLDDASFDLLTKELEVDAVDIDDADRRLTDNATTTTPATTPEPPRRTVVGNINIGGMNNATATAFINNTNVLTALKAAIANKAGAAVSANMISLALTIVASRRLQAEELVGAEPRQLQGTVTVNVQYTITLASGAAESVATGLVTTLTAVTAAQFQTEFVAALPAAERATYESLITITMVPPVAVAPGGTVPTTTTTLAGAQDSGAKKMALTSSMLVLSAALLKSVQL